MKKTFLLLSLALALLACNNSVDSSNTLTKADSIIVKPNDSLVEDEYELDPEYEVNYIVALTEGYNYDSLHRVALDAAELLDIKFDSLDRYYNTKRKKIILPENYEDDMWAGEYYFRRSADAFVSIEMKYMYADTLTEKNEDALQKFTADSLKMFVFAGMSPNKATADSLARLLKPHYGKLQVFPSNIFMGCMH